MEILLVEDSLGYQRLMKEAFKTVWPEASLSFTEDGAQAMAFLQKLPPYENAARPDVIILDLNLPRKNGREFLADAKNDPGLAGIPVTVLTSSKSPEDIEACKLLQVREYLTKPAGYQELVDTVEAIKKTHLSGSGLPS
jgi:CheY-like chemotaxis protein